jgi:hypothetical protein
MESNISRIICQLWVSKNAVDVHPFITIHVSMQDKFFLFFLGPIATPSEASGHQLLL